MSLERFISLRYLKARNVRSFMSTISIISIGGVMVGVCALLVILSVMEGYEADLSQRLIGMNAHGNLYKITYGFGEYPQVIEKLEAMPEVKAATPFILREGMISSEEEVSGALIKGIDIDSTREVTTLAEQLTSGSLESLEKPEQLLADTQVKVKEQEKEGRPDRSFYTRTKRRYGEQVLPGIVIGEELANFLKVGVGDEVNLVNPLGGGLGAAGPIPSNQYFRIAAIFSSGMFDYDMKFCFTTLKALQEFADMDTNITGIEFKVYPEYVYSTHEISRKIVKELGGFPYQVRDWRDMNRNLFAALKLQRIVMFLILCIIILVASFGIASTLIMIVLEKNKEIAILKSLGASRISIMKIFMYDGLIIGLIGTIAGIGLGLLLCQIIPAINYELDSAIYAIKRLPVKVEGINVLLVAISALAISWVATLYPSFKAAGLNPVDGLRND